MWQFYANEIYPMSFYNKIEKKTCKKLLKAEDFVSWEPEQL